MADLNVKNYLKGLTREELNQKWVKFCKTPPPKHLGKSYLIKQIAWFMEHQGLKKETQKTLDKLVKQYEKTKSVRVSEMGRQKKLDVKMGTKFIREYKSVKYEVTVVENGYSYNGKIYKSITAVAKEITGTGWNGKRFFGVNR